MNEIEHAKSDKRLLLSLFVVTAWVVGSQAKVVSAAAPTKPVLGSKIAPPEGSNAYRVAPTQSVNHSSASSRPSDVDYNYTESSGTIVPGTEDTGSHCDDCSTPITLPFAYTLYD